MPQRLRCTVTEVLAHGEQVYSVFLQPESLAPRFQPGQFLHLALDEYSPGDFWPDSRPFSIASAPTERGLLRITYAVKGQFTHRMEAELRVGREVWVKMPYGEFIVNAETDVCLLAGGTGITAFTAFLVALPKDHPHRVYLFYGARRPELLLYRPMVEAASARCPGLRVYLFAEEGANGTGCQSGRIDLEIAWKKIAAPLSTIYYLAGPPAMIHALPNELAQRGVPSDRVLIDAWD